MRPAFIPWHIIYVTCTYLSLLHQMVPMNQVSSPLLFIQLAHTAFAAAAESEVARVHRPSEAIPTPPAVFPNYRRSSAVLRAAAEALIDARRFSCAGHCRRHLYRRRLWLQCPAVHSGNNVRITLLLKHLAHVAGA